MPVMQTSPLSTGFSLLIIISSFSAFSYDMDCQGETERMGGGGEGGGGMMAIIEREIKLLIVESLFYADGVCGFSTA